MSTRTAAIDASLWLHVACCCCHKPSFILWKKWMLFRMGLNDIIYLAQLLQLWTKWTLPKQNEVDHEVGKFISCIFIRHWQWLPNCLWIFIFETLFNRHL